MGALKKRQPPQIVDPGIRKRSLRGISFSPCTARAIGLLFFNDQPQKFKSFPAAGGSRSQSGRENQSGKFSFIRNEIPLSN